MLKVAFHPLYIHPLPPNHRFPMEKYELVPKQLLHEGTCTEENFFKPEIASDEDILGVHSKEYLKKLNTLALDRDEVRISGFPLSKSLVHREKLIVGGTVESAQYALENGISMNIAGGTHHAYSNRAEGFCLLNDQAVAARYLIRNRISKKILILDLDVHQGNGTAAIFQDDDRVFTFSMHGKNNFPFHKEKSDLDIELPNGTQDEEYLQMLKDILPVLIESEEPDFLFYLCGVDILSSDKLGKLSCSISGCKDRDRIVLEICREKGIPVQCSMGGGYSRDIKEIIEAHANTFRLAQDIYF